MAPFLSFAMLQPSNHHRYASSRLLGVRGVHHSRRSLPTLMFARLPIAKLKKGAM